MRFAKIMGVLLMVGAWTTAQGDIEVPKSIQKRHAYIKENTLPPKVGLVIFSSQDRSESTKVIKKHIEDKYNFPVVATMTASKKEPQRYAAIVSEMLKHPGVELVVSVGGTGFSPDDRAIELTREFVDKEIEQYPAYFKEATTKSDMPDGVDPKTLTIQTKTKAFTTKNGKIVLFAPGSPHGAITALDVLLPEAKFFFYHLKNKDSETATTFTND